MHRANDPSLWPTPSDDDRCPCLSGETYGSCCGPFHRGEADAPTATRLMRSRYSAFVIGAADYLLDTWHPTTRPATLDLDPTVRWFRLDLEGSTRGGLLDTEGTVQFTAHFRHDGEAHSQHELSRFTKLRGRWYYLDAA
ncbi:MAG: zinc-binding protein [Frondihabitans sp.]|nr:zinc-binding protein [Frondihabitans sp.]